MKDFGGFWGFCEEDDASTDFVESVDESDETTDLGG